MSNYKSPAYTLRSAGTAMAAQNSYDTLASATKLDVPNARNVELFCTYTRGAVGGAFKLKVYTSADGTNFAERTIIDGSSLASGAVNVFTFEPKFPVSAGATPEIRSIIIDVSTCLAIKVLASEYGHATVGTLEIKAICGL